MTRTRRSAKTEGSALEAVILVSDDDRLLVAGTGSSRCALQAVTGSSHIFGGGRLTGLAGDSRSRPL